MDELRVGRVAQVERGEHDVAAEIERAVLEAALRRRDHGDVSVHRDAEGLDGAGNRDVAEQAHVPGIADVDHTDQPHSGLRLAARRRRAREQEDRGRDLHHVPVVLVTAARVDGGKLPIPSLFVPLSLKRTPSFTPSRPAGVPFWDTASPSKNGAVGSAMLTANMPPVCARMT